MIVPCIDLVGGRAVQMVGGEAIEIDGGDPMPIAERFGRVGEIAIVDIDAARGEGSNRELILELVRRHRCRVGGGIRTAEEARAWLDAGAQRVVLGTAAVPEVLEQLPKNRVVAAVDGRDGQVVTHGWRQAAGDGVFERIQRIGSLVGGVLVTQVEREGRMVGADLEFAAKVRALLPREECEVTLAGGVATASEIRSLDELGIDAQVGMAIYRGDLPLAEAFAAPLVSDRSDELFATVVWDASGAALGLCWSSLRSLAQAIDSGRGVYESRKRGLWEKGASSGSTQELLRIDVDCDRDALRFVVRQAGAGFCHRETATCWGRQDGLARLEKTLFERASEVDAVGSSGSYAHRLFRDPALLRSKLIEEAMELSEATSPANVVHEAADVLFFTLATMRTRGVSLAAVAAELDARSDRLSRRPGDAKPSTPRPAGPRDVSTEGDPS